MSDLDDAIEQHMAHIVFEEQHPFSPNEISKDIALDQIVTHNLTIKVIGHHTDTVSVAISCSFRPTLIDLKYMIQLFGALTGIEVYFASILENAKNGYSSTVVDVDVPSYRQWMAKMWHFGVDTIDEYVKKEFEVTFEEGMSDLYRIYSKRMKGGKKKS